MQTSNVNPHLLMNTAIEALKHAYEGCPSSSTGAKIIIAFKAIIQLQHELENSTRQCRNDAGGDRIRHSCGCCAAS
jgi:alcohol dehydrogenase class IV